ncbi:hypothetical protein PIB30_068405 [Stylosanthes scabra]|uniref:Uncharacterized protein n=1 Tax=Stylosanthes scabra TaxID=79078 RepID=A0ABU6YLP9_9FABA|nr:hypothetical protein [Stylosanthes scabra]
MDHRQPMQPDSHELDALLGFDIDIDFESLFQELPRYDNVFGTSDTSSLPQGTSQTGQDTLTRPLGWSCFRSL